MYQGRATDGAIIFLVGMFWYAAVSVGLAIPLVIRFQSTIFPTESAALAAAEAALDREADAVSRLVLIKAKTQRSKDAPDAIARRVEAIDHEIAAQWKRFRDAQHRRSSLDPHSAAIKVRSGLITGLR
jgi:hypothetical protein